MADIEYEVFDTLWFHTFLDIKDFYQYEFEFRITYLMVDNENDWSFRLERQGKDFVYMSLPDRGGYMTDIAKNSTFVEYLQRLAKEDASVKTSLYETEYDFYNSTSLFKVLDFIKTKYFGVFSFHLSVGVYSEDDFNNVRDIILQNNKCPSAVKKVVNKITPEKLYKNSFSYRFGEQQSILMGYHEEKKKFYFYFNENCWNGE